MSVFFNNSASFIHTTENFFLGLLVFELEALENFFFFESNFENSFERIEIIIFKRKYIKPYKKVY